MHSFFRSSTETLLRTYGCPESRTSLNIDPNIFAYWLLSPSPLVHPLISVGPSPRHEVMTSS